MLICKQIQYTQDTIQIQYNTQYAQSVFYSVFYSMKDWMWKMKLTFELPRKERVLWRWTVADSKEGEGSPVQRNAKRRREVEWSPVQRNAKGRQEVEWSLIRRKAKGRRFKGMRRVAIELNRRQLALNRASSATVWASSATAKLNHDGGSLMATMGA